MTTDTPRTDACPYCGDEPCAYPQDDPAWQEYRCGTVYGYYPSDLCREREARQKLEAEVEKLKEENILPLLLVADIRAAVGDPTGKLMQDELVDHCKNFFKRAEKAEAEVEKLNRLLCDLLILTEKQYWNSNNYKQIKKAYHENK
jgi:hypothetical protein